MTETLVVAAVLVAGEVLRYRLYERLYREQRASLDRTAEHVENALLRLWVRS